ncbi:MAG: flagellin FliC [bacterium]|nr:flagellin FliC [bacterium]MCP4800716.1 flagellin FliC [bacterium]
MRINTNIASINAQRHLWNTGNTVSKSMERLSSGLRINRAADDAAGLAISEGMKSDIRALGQASKNAADGISMVQIAEGSMDEVNSILIRMRELAQQASNETLGATERGYIDDEFQALSAEIDRISTSTDFNGIALLDGTAGSLDIQVGIGTTAADAIAVDLTTATNATTLGVVASDLTGADNTNAQLAVTALDGALDIVLSSRAGFGAAQNRFESAMRSIANSIENIAAANSRIRDTDLAYETSVMTNNQILQQAGVSVLAQANQSQALALSLFQ